jgi:hypothetical protein
MVEHESALSDALLRQLMAVGQVDILVGLPTLNNAATVTDIVRAVHVAFNRDFPRLRTVMINSDGGSTDGTQELVRGATLTESDMVQTSHSLRTLHRVLAPYHGLPGKHTALRAIFAAAELAQAKVLVVLDPSGPTTTPERVTELIVPVNRAEAEFVAPRYRRHPRDGVLVTQLVRPFVRAIYGVGLDEPLGVEFACSGQFASHCLEQDIWSHEAARFAIDLWLRTEAVATGVSVAQIWRPATSAAGPRATLREAVQQIELSLVECLRAHHSFWTASDGIVDLPNFGTDTGPVPDPPTWDVAALAEQARRDLLAISPVLTEVLEPETVSRVVEDISRDEWSVDDVLWVKVVYAFAAAMRRSRTGSEHLAAMFVPLYLWRAAAFMARTAPEQVSTVQQRLDALCETFLRLKPVLVNRWSADV